MLHFFHSLFVCADERVRSALWSCINVFLVIFIESFSRVSSSVFHSCYSCVL